ncbi:hypothetical protein [Streptomyces sp. NPDC093589]|uniref:hypothetical protein n=1 Tax=Streptomyces sp. NPDC093589 TaxID=3366043 RepID=UPI0037FE89A0
MIAEPSPMCEERRHRTVIIELDGLLQHVPAEYHPSGAFVGRMVTARAFYAESRFGECPVPVPMPLHRPTACTDPRLIVIDNLAERWVMGFAIQYKQLIYRITRFYPTADVQPAPSTAARQHAMTLPARQRASPT